LLLKVQASNPPLSGPFASNPYAVSVTTASQVAAFFSKLFGYPNGMPESTLASPRWRPTQLSCNCRKHGASLRLAAHEKRQNPPLHLPSAAPAASTGASFQRRGVTDRHADFSSAEAAKTDMQTIDQPLALLYP
jgi:hypothetical protein